MNRGPFSSNRSGVKSGFLSRGALRLPDWSGRSCSAPRSCWLGLGDQQLRQPLEIQDPADQQRLLADAAQPAPAEAPQAVPVLALAKELLNQLPAPLRQVVTAAALPHPHPRMGVGAAPDLRRDMWLDAPREQRLEEVLVEEPLVGAERGGGKAQPAFRPIQQGQTEIGRAH